MDNFYGELAHADTVREIEREEAEKMICMDLSDCKYFRTNGSIVEMLHPTDGYGIIFQYDTCKGKRRFKGNTAESFFTEWREY